MRIPRKITPDPILSSAIEVRFQSSLPESAVFGTIYNKLCKNYPNYKNIGIPNEMKQVVHQLRYSADAEIFNDDYIIGISANTIIFRIQKQYKGWNSFYATFTRDFSSLLNIDDLFKEIERIGLRYINFFKVESNIFNSFNLKIDFANIEHYEIDNIMYRTILKKDNVNLTLRIEDKVKAITSEEGLLLDIDAYQIKDTITLSKDKVIEIVDKLHKSEKHLFFGMLKEDFLNKFNPEYED